MNTIALYVASFTHLIAWGLCANYLIGTRGKPFTISTAIVASLHVLSVGAVTHIPTPDGYIFLMLVGHGDPLIDSLINSYVITEWAILAVCFACLMHMIYHLVYMVRKPQGAYPDMYGTIGPVG